MDKRLEQSGQHRAPGHRGDRERARRVHEVQGDLPGRSVREAARRRRRGAAPAVGVDRGQEPALPGHDVRGHAGRAAHRQHDADADAARGRRARRDLRRDSRPGSERRPRRSSPTPGSTWTTSPTSCCARASTRSSSRSTGCSTASSRCARRSSPAARPRSGRSIPDELEPAIAEKGREAKAENVAQRVWRKDDTLWGEAGAPEVANRLGWLTISESMLEEAADLEAWTEEVKRDGFTDCALLGMGGSSLGPEVIRRSFGPLEHGLRLHVLDSTDPGAVAELEQGGGPLEDALPRVEQVAAARSRRCRTSATSSTRRAGTARSSSRSPTRAARCRSSPRSAASGESSRMTRTSAGATRCCPTSGSCRRP